MTPEEISERFIGTHPSDHGQFKTWDELRLSHETQIEKYAQQFKDELSAAQSERERLLDIATLSELKYAEASGGLIQAKQEIEKLTSEKEELQTEYDLLAETGRTTVVNREKEIDELKIEAKRKDERIEACRNYLMVVNPSDVNIGDALEALGFNRNGF